MIPYSLPGIVEVAALIKKLSGIGQNHEAVGESLGNEDEVVALGGEQHAGPFSESRRADSYVYRNVQHFPLHHAAELGLRMPQLVMETAQRSFCGARLVVLDENIVDAEIGKLLLVVRLQEKASRVAEYFRLKLPDFRK